MPSTDKTLFMGHVYKMRQQTFKIDLKFIICTSNRQNWSVGKTKRRFTDKPAALCGPSTNDRFN